MKSRKWRLALAAILFVAWIGWLAYTASANRNPIVISRPQLLAANVHVIATLSGTDKPNAKIVVDKVLWAGDGGSPKNGDAIDVSNLRHIGAANGWNGAGAYVVPLLRAKKKGKNNQGKFEYAAAITPSSPGYPPASLSAADRLAIYPATEPVLGQLREIYKEWGR